MFSRPVFFFYQIESEKDALGPVYTGRKVVGVNLL